MDDYLVLVNKFLDKEIRKESVSLQPQIVKWPYDTRGHMNPSREALTGYYDVIRQRNTSYLPDGRHTGSSNPSVNRGYQTWKWLFALPHSSQNIDKILVEMLTSMLNVALLATGKAVSPPSSTSFKKYNTVMYLHKKVSRFLLGL